MDVDGGTRGCAGNVQATAETCHALADRTRPSAVRAKIFVTEDDVSRLEATTVIAHTHVQSGLQTVHGNGDLARTAATHRIGDCFRQDETKLMSVFGGNARAARDNV
jgi:hypothetical protein